MKKFIFTSIFLFGIFAIQNSFANCYSNYRYNGEKVFYCEGNNSDSYNYNGYYNNSSYYSNSDDDNSYPYYANDAYYESISNSNPYSYGVNSDEENRIKLQYLNNLGGPGDTSMKKDFFKTNVIGNDKELNTIDAVIVKPVSYKAASWNSKYSNSVRFFDGLKNEIKVRYNEGKISYNQINDIKNDLETLVYNLNNQFLFYKKFESTKQNMYKDMAEDSATQVRTNYDKLKFTLGNL